MRWEDDVQEEWMLEEVRFVLSKLCMDILPLALSIWNVEKEGDRTNVIGWRILEDMDKML